MADPASIAALYGLSAVAQGVSNKFQKKGRWNQLSTMTPDQIQRGNFAGQRGQDLINNPYQGFDAIGNNAINQYKQQVLPGLYEQFAGLGDNLPSSGAFHSTLNQAGTGLTERLAALQAQYGQQQQNFGLNLLDFGQRPQFENYYQQPEPTFLSGLFGGLGNAAGSYGQLGLGKRMGLYNGGNQGYGTLGDQQMMNMWNQRGY